MSGLVAAGWLAARAFESPAQREARARPPTPKPITAAVVVDTLADEVTARAEIAPRLADRLVPPALAERAVVTGHMLARGTIVRPGASLLAINGRPLLVLPGRFSFYREIAAGMTGPDVAQLQAGLAAAGFTTGGERAPMARPPRRRFERCMPRPGRRLLPVAAGSRLPPVREREGLRHPSRRRCCRFFR